MAAPSFDTQIKVSVHPDLGGFLEGTMPNVTITDNFFE